jgi:hypothetical protein
VKAILAVEDWGNAGFIGIGYTGNSTPRLGRFERDGTFLWNCETGYLSKEKEHLTDNGELYLKLVEVWLRDSQNDSLRARGDIRWRVMSRAQGILRGEK